MDFFQAAVPFIKVVISFVIMLAGIRKKLGLAPSILAGGVFLGVSFGLGVKEIGLVGLRALVGDKFLLLLAIVGLILILSDGLERSGQSKRLMDTLSGFLTKPRLRLIFFPALIGLLPMPGGAVFSAPMVKAVSEDMGLAPVSKVLINYWFRHVWEMAWPLYPGIILTVALAEIPVSSLISRTWPGVIGMFLIGYFFFLRPGVIEVRGGKSEGGKPKKIRGVFIEGTPLLIAIIGAVGLEMAIARFFPGIPFELGVIVALFTAVCSIMVQNRLGLKFLQEVLTKKSLWTMLGVIASIFVFKDIMGEAGVVGAMAESAGGGVALMAAAVFLPFLVGMVSGINVAFVGATFPLLLGLLKNLGMEDQMIPYLILGSFSGFTGVMISPLHICFVLTNDYFGVDLYRSWRKMILPCLCLGGIGVALFFIV